MIALTGIPVLETERLILRGPQLGDFEHFADFMTTDRSRMVGGPLTRDLAWRSFGHTVGHWALRGYGSFTITEAATGAVLGRTGGIYPEGWPEPEIGWAMWSPAAEGKGYVFEAASAVRGWLYDHCGWTTAISLIAADNPRSQALARRLGATPERETLVTGITCTIWRHPAADSLQDGGMEAYA